MRNLGFFIFLITYCLSSWGSTFRFIAIGDVPYREPAGSKMFKSLIQQINQRDIDFTIHVGDIKDGGSPCTDKALLNVRDMFNAFKRPLYYTPGDNEWTDCHRDSNGKMDPLERLEFLRKHFFAKPESLGLLKRPYKSQSQIEGYEKYVENYYFEHKGGIVASLHLVGSNNNMRKESPQAMKEHLDRQRANLAWLDRVFELSRKAKFLILFFQAEIGWEKQSEQFEGFAEVRNKISAYDKISKTPILLIHGDEHRFKIDHPVPHKDTESGIYGHKFNIMRLEVYGFPDVRAVEVQVNTKLNQPFSFTSLDNIKWEYGAVNK